MSSLEYFKAWFSKKYLNNFLPCDNLQGMYTPTFERFVTLAEKGNMVPVYREIMADMETPVSAFLKIETGEYSYLLESVEGGEKWARYCFLGSNPSIIFKIKKSVVSIFRNGFVTEKNVSGNPLDSLKDLMAEFKAVDVPGLPRFYGGAVGYIGYDMVRFIEDLPEDTIDDLDVNDAIFVITDSILIFDNVKKKIKVVSNVLIDEDDDLEETYKRATRKIDSIVDQLKKPLDRSSLSQQPSGKLPPSVSNVTKEKFMEGVEKCKDYIREGDIFQVVLSQRLATPITSDPFDLYRALRTVNPSPYMYFLRLGDLCVVGSSPEVLVRVEDDKVELRPIAGTRPRGADEADDLRLEKDMLQDAKECAEHIMLVDLGRNDLGRVSKPGTVDVNEMMVIERYSHVMHMVSNVKAKLQEGEDSFSVLKASFPAGTLSGAPKIRAMEIIEEIEPTRRGIYGGSVGYFGFSGNMDMAITIRTLLVKDNTAYLGIGAGIVADSNPESEFDETMNKGKAMIKAIEIAERGLL